MKKIVQIFERMVLLLVFITGCAYANNVESKQDTPLPVKELKGSKTPGKAKGSDEYVYYARCNLKVLNGNHITWVNWQDSPTFIPVGTRLKVEGSGKKISLINAGTGDRYTLDMGAKGDVFLEKFVTKELPVDINTFPAEIQVRIKDTTAGIGMTKEQVYISMGPPIGPKDSRTNTMTYKDIMNINLWVYAKRRFQNIYVSFDPETGRVNKIEGFLK